MTTGFGSLANTYIPADRREELQRALVRSHAAGMGPPVEREVVRAMMLLRARTLAMGRSGARPVVAETMLALLNAGITPVVREHGSLGARGDLAPLAHCALALIGEGEVSDADGAAPRRRRRAAATPASSRSTLAAKEGLALINGTDGMLGMLLLALHDLRTPAARRRHHGRDDASRRCSAPTAPSPRTSSRCARSPARRRARRTCARCWPARRSSPATARTTRACRTPTRCAARPQVHGAARDTVAHAEGVAAAELVSAIDNPMVLPDGRVESCGNFHGAPLALRLRLPRDRRRRGRRDRRAPHRPPARRRPLATACRRS